MSLFDEPSRKPLPQPTFEDVKYAGGKVLASMIPFVGGAASELLGLLSSPLAERRDDWFEDLARRLHDLEGTVEGFHFDDLSQNEQFVSATLQATHIALRTHQKQKLEALRNAVLNTAVGNTPNDDLQSIFLSLVDRLTPLHLVLLKNIQTPRILPNSGNFQRWENEDRQNRIAGAQRIGSTDYDVPPAPMRFFRAQVEQLKNQRDEFVGYLLRELYVAGLSRVNPDEPNFRESTLTDLGKQFLQYITFNGANQ